MASANASAVGYAAFRQIGPDGQPIKKKGRPVGWKKSIHSREAQGLSPKSAPKKEERVPKQPVNTIVEPQWSDFTCRWDGCGTKLMNLDTLKKHLIRVHAPIFQRGQSHSCDWRGCKNEGDDLQDMLTWLGHVDREHLQPMAWKLGDGPKGSASSDLSSPSGSDARYLFDRSGRRVTPIISPPDASSAPNTGDISSTLQPIKRIGRPPMHSEDTAHPVNVLKELEAYKLAIGPTMDREGCVLVSRERRDTFLGDEDFERVVYEHESDRESDAASV